MDMQSVPDVPQRETQTVLELATRFSAPESPVGDARFATAGTLLDTENTQSVLVALFHWLTTSLTVELVAYWNPRLRKSHLVCQTPPGERERLRRMVDGLMNGAVPRIRHWRQQQWNFHLWMGSPLESGERLLVVEREGQLSSEACNLLLQEAIAKFHPRLQQAGHENAFTAPVG
ncbi:MAG: hypothetical protein HQM02_07685 [Magnetococcales bacterium]|nr:hypothetical protein [Magnetococcales bacterium]